MRRVLALGFLLLGTGCSMVPHPGPRQTMGPPYIPPPEPVWVVIDPALFAEPDSADEEVAEARRRPRPRTVVSPSGSVARPRGPELREVVPAPPEPGSPEAAALAQARADSVRAVEARAALISVDLDLEDQARLARAARKNLSAADSLAKIAGARPASQRDPHKLETAQGLIRQAQEALQRGDIKAAANLAYKARLLAAEAHR